MATYNKTLTDADTEYSQELERSARSVTIQCRTSAAIRVAFVTGKVATSTAPYLTVKADGALTLPLQPSAGPHTLYLASASAAVVAEIETGHVSGAT